MRASSFILLSAALALWFLAAPTDARYCAQAPSAASRPVAAAKHSTLSYATKHAVGVYPPGSVLLITDGTFSNAAFHPSFPTNDGSTSGTTGGSFVMMVAGNLTQNVTVTETQLVFIVNTTSVSTVFYDPLALNAGLQSSTSMTLVPLMDTDLATVTLVQKWNCANSGQSYLLQLMVKGQKTGSNSVNYIIDPYVSACYNPKQGDPLPSFSSVSVINPSAAFIQPVNDTYYQVFFSSDNSTVTSKGTGLLLSYPSAAGYILYQYPGCAIPPNFGPYGGTRVPGSNVTQFQAPSVGMVVPVPTPAAPNSCQQYGEWKYLLTTQPLDSSFAASSQVITIDLYDYACYQWMQQNSDDGDGGDHPKKIVIIGVIIAIALVLLALGVGCFIKRRSSSSTSDAYQTQI